MAQASTPISTTNTERSSPELPTTLLCVNLVLSSPSHHDKNSFQPPSSFLPRPQRRSLRYRPGSTVVRRRSSARPATTELLPAAELALAVVTETGARGVRRRELQEELRGRVAAAARSNRSTSLSAPCAQYYDDFDDFDDFNDERLYQQSNLQKC